VNYPFNETVRALMSYHSSRLIHSRCYKERFTLYKMIDYILGLLGCINHNALQN